MGKVLLVAVLWAGCGTDVQAPDAALPEWSCRMFVDCAGSAQVIERSVNASNETDAEIQLVDECEAMACSGALACHAICEMP